MSQTPTPPDQRCPHFDACGGCCHQDLTYEDQLAQKTAELQALFRPYWSAPIPITPSPEIWHYRNKVEFNFDRKYYDERPPDDFIRESVLGFKRRGKWYWTLDLETCLIAPKACDQLLQSVRHWMREHDIRAHYRRPADGTLRHLVVRQGKRTGQLMIALLSADDSFDTEPFVKAVLDAVPADSIYHGIFHGTADAAYADEWRLLHGTETIDERLLIPTGNQPRELVFRISPTAFFQTNTLATEQLYGQLREWVADLRPPHLYDLYGGAGGIALSCADLVDTITSVEEVEAATRDGRTNAERNQTTTIDFITQDVRRFLQACREGQQTLLPEATVVLDPPRAGLHPKALSHVTHLAPRDVIYVSCNPKMLAREMETWTWHYHLLDLQAVDLFPHTPHVEVLARFRRRDQEAERTT